MMLVPLFPLPNDVTITLISDNARTHNQKPKRRQRFPIRGLTRAHSHDGVMLSSSQRRSGGRRRPRRQSSRDDDMLLQPVRRSASPPPCRWDSSSSVSSSNLSPSRHSFPVVRRIERWDSSPHMPTTKKSLVDQAPTMKQQRRNHSPITILNAMQQQKSASSPSQSGGKHIANGSSDQLKQIAQKLSSKSSDGPNPDMATILSRALGEESGETVS